MKRGTLLIQNIHLGRVLMGMSCNSSGLSRFVTTETSAQAVGGGLRGLAVGDPDVADHILRSADLSAPASLRSLDDSPSLFLSGINTFVLFCVSCCSRRANMLQEVSLRQEARLDPTPTSLLAQTDQ